MNLVMVSCVALIDKDGYVLLSQRPSSKYLAGKWEFPGGKVEPGETPKIALIREIEEELGISTHSSCLAPIAFSEHLYHPKDQPAFCALVLLFACRVWENIVTPKEQQQLKWAQLEEIKQLEFIEGSQSLIPFLRDYI
ncbi:MAG: (deoxy)nucleoside triphosphate pyrophosphohydrolase [Pseudomonadota bacterium]